MLKIRKLIKRFLEENKGAYTLVILAVLLIVGTLTAVTFGDNTSKQIDGVSEVVGDKIDEIATDLAEESTP